MIKRILDRIHHYRAVKSNKRRDEVINLLFILWEKLRKNGKNNADNYLNACVYILLVNRDIFYLYSLFYFEKNSLKKNFYGRLLSMTIYEYLSDVNHLIGKSMIQEIERNNWDSDLIIDLRKICKSYSMVKKKFERELKEIRNNASAHKSKESERLYHYTKLDFKFLYAICPILMLIEIEFDNISMKFNQISE